MNKTPALVSGKAALATRHVSAKKPATGQWWRGAVIYQIYTRSFLDSNGDGIGDLRGIIDRLDYVADLGVDAIWISPFYRSPMKDCGYDVSDYRSVDPMFGTLGDFDRLVAEAHRLKLRVIIDLVLSHSSDQHPWFQESRQNRDNKKANWYVWADPQPDGTPPNNWLSIFGGSAWQWESRRQQYYLHNFLASQPDLNFHEPQVSEEMLSVLEFWLERGIDGVRLDAVNFYFHDPELRDNPAKAADQRQGRGFGTENPYAWQHHIYDNTRPENLAFVERLRAICDRYDDIVTLGEISAERSVETSQQYTHGNRRLHMAYNFELLVDQFSLAHIRNSVEISSNESTGGWPCRSIGNHDVARVATRWARDQVSDSRSKLLNALLLSLPGTVCTYQGEELGLTEAEIPLELVRDPYGLAFWPHFKGRDGCRTPMPWRAAPQEGGFSNAKPWLPLPDEHRDAAVDRQLCESSSVLNSYRMFVRWRCQQPALCRGDIGFIQAPADTLCFVRSFKHQKILACFNFSNECAALELPELPELPEGSTANAIGRHGLPTGHVDGGKVTIPANGVFFAELGEPPKAE